MYLISIHGTATIIYFWGQKDWFLKIQTIHGCNLALVAGNHSLQMMRMRYVMQEHVS